MIKFYLLAEQCFIRRSDTSLSGFATKFTLGFSTSDKHAETILASVRHFGLERWFARRVSWSLFGLDQSEHLWDAIFCDLRRFSPVTSIYSNTLRKLPHEPIWRVAFLFTMSKKQSMRVSRMKGGWFRLGSSHVENCGQTSRPLRDPSPPSCTCFKVSLPAFTWLHARAHPTRYPSSCIVFAFIERRADGHAHGIRQRSVHRHAGHAY